MSVSNNYIGNTSSNCYPLKTPWFALLVQWCTQLAGINCHKITSTKHIYHWYWHMSLCVCVAIQWKKFLFSMLSFSTCCTDHLSTRTICFVYVGKGQIERNSVTQEEPLHSSQSIYFVILTTGHWPLHNVLNAQEGDAMVLKYKDGIKDGRFCSCTQNHDLLNLICVVIYSKLVTLLPKNDQQCFRNGPLFKFVKFLAIVLTAWLEVRYVPLQSLSLQCDPLYYRGLGNKYTNKIKIMHGPSEGIRKLMTWTYRVEDEHSTQ